MSSLLAARILDVLPQTQCQRCGFEDCASYAQAIANQEARINRCPPGGLAGIAQLAVLTGQPTEPLDAECGVESIRKTFFIDEAWCIGCTLCVAACPTDAIVGGNKLMHAVWEQYCTGCELCLPVCPVDCIVGEDTSTPWTPEQAHIARERYAAKRIRTQREQEALHEHNTALAQRKLEHLAAHSRIEDPEILAKKKAIIEAAMERARAKRKN